MNFPLVFDMGAVKVSGHLLFEVLAYAVAFQLYRRLRRARGDIIGDIPRLELIAAAILGAAVGSKVLHHLNSPSAMMSHLGDPLFLMGGKTIVGALVGGLLAVELVKHLRGITRRTGDLYVFPLIVGTMIGRIGCFSAGVTDDTHGKPTDFFLAMDLGDGVLRHPTALYEFGFLTALALGLGVAKRRVLPEGRLFELYMLGYCSFRFAADFLKPGERFAFLTVIQMVALATVAFYLRRIARGARTDTGDLAHV